MTRPWFEVLLLFALAPALWASETLWASKIMTRTSAQRTTKRVWLFWETTRCCVVRRSRLTIITDTMLVSTRDQTARELHDTREMRLKRLCIDTMLLCYFAWARVGTRASNKQQTRNDDPRFLERKHQCISQSVRVLFVK